MKNLLPLVLFISFLFPLHLFSQEKDSLAAVSTPAPKMVQREREPNRINPGFYLKIGPTFPLGNYALGQNVYDHKPSDTAIYYPATMGAAMDMGFLIYIGPSFAANHLRAGIDATFISVSFNSINSGSVSGPKSKYWYYYLGQKFGPVLSVCPIDRLVIDISYKLNAYVAYVHHQVRHKENDEWGSALTQGEFSMNIRYSIMLFSFQYNAGKAGFDDFDGAKPMHYVDNTTFRVMVGFKF